MLLRVCVFTDLTVLLNVLERKSEVKASVFLQQMYN